MFRGQCCTWDFQTSVTYMGPFNATFTPSSPSSARIQRPRPSMSERILRADPAATRVLDVSRIAWLACIAAIAAAGPALAQPGATWDVFRDASVPSAATSGVTAELDRRNITLSGSKLFIPVIASAETSVYGKLHTVLEIANITDSEADYSLRFLGADGTALSMPIQGSCPTCAVPASSRQATVSAHGGRRIVILPQNPLKIGWAEFTSDPDASLSVSAVLYAEGTDGTVGRAGIPPTSTYERAWLYNDNTSNLTTRVLLVNPSSTGQRTYQLQYRDFSDTSSICQASVQVAALGQALIETADSLACSSGGLGLVEISGDHEFTGIAVVSDGDDGTIFTRQLVEMSDLGEDHPRLDQWTITTGSVTYGSITAAGCIAVTNTSINGVLHTVHTSKWQQRAEAESAWADIPNTSRSGLVCAYSQSANEHGQYRGVAEITIGGERGTYATKNVLTVGDTPGTTDSQPSFGAATVGAQAYSIGTAISPLTLPAASGGDGALIYSLAPGVSGLSFDAATRVLSGAPTAVGTYNMTYSVRDADGDMATLNFVVTVSTAQMTTVDLVVASVTASDTTPEAGQAFDLTATTRNRGTGASAATTLRFYRSTNTTISRSDTQVGMATVSALAAGGNSSSVLTLTAPATAGTYYYGACVDTVTGESSTQNNCSSAVTVTVTGAGAAASFDLHASNQFPEGITFANNRFYVADWFDERIYAYSASGQSDPAASFDLHASNQDPRGITFANNRFYVADWFDERIYAYSASGQSDPAASFDLRASNQDPRGIAFANNRFYVADWSDERIYAYSTSGQSDPAASFDLHASNRHPEGITFANNRFYVTDRSDDRIYAYSTSGQSDPAASFDLHASNQDPRGITFANNRFYVADWSDERIYAYSASGTSTDPETTTGTGGSNQGASACSVGALLSPGESCTHSSSGNSFTFNVRNDGFGCIGSSICAGTGLRINNFVAEKQADGRWLIVALP